MRQSKTIIIESGRDAGKTFEITEPDAFTGESLFIRFMAVCGEIDNPAEIAGMLTQTPQGKEVWNELINYVKILPSSNPEIKRAIDKEDIEDFNTLIHLRTQALKLILNFTQE